MCSSTLDLLTAAESTWARLSRRTTWETQHLVLELSPSYLPKSASGDSSPAPQALLFQLGTRKQQAEGSQREGLKHITSSAISPGKTQVTGPHFYAVISSPRKLI